MATLPTSIILRSECRCLFNASNLHTGGGIQVATSVICEWIEHDALPEGLVIWVSTEVDANIRAAGCDTSRLPHYRVVDSHGLKLLFSPLAKELQAFDRVFTLFGPLYQVRCRPYSIVGFAQPWIIYPDNPEARRMTVLAQTRTRLKFLVQRWFFQRADVLVAELEHVADSLVRVGLAESADVRVVHNCLGSIYLQPERWLPLASVSSRDCLKIGFVGRNYPHKNTKILPAVKGLLNTIHDLDVEFYVTFTTEEWQTCSASFRAAVNNVGALSVAQCPTFYQQMDAVIFPSFLECFSATPLEALAMERPLFASDRAFNRDICGAHAIYFDPEKPEDAARVIAGYFSDTAERSASLAAARLHALNFSNARDRALKYLALLMPIDSDLKGATRVPQ